MAKKKYSRKKRQKAMEIFFYGVLIAGVILLIVLAVMPDQPASSAGYVITEEGHVHDADGNHIGAYDENTGLVITDDGHVHTVDGAHVGEVVTEEPANAEPETDTEAETAAE